MHLYVMYRFQKLQLSPLIARCNFQLPCQKGSAHLGMPCWNLKQHLWSIMAWWWHTPSHRVLMEEH